MTSLRELAQHPHFQLLGSLQLLATGKDPRRTDEGGLRVAAALFRQQERSGDEYTHRTVAKGIVSFSLEGDRAA
eukprot:scaffold43696_cov48-Attheya_sp.AAC.1